MKLKKWISLFLASLMIIASLSGCAKPAAQAAETPVAQTPAATASPVPATETPVSEETRTVVNLDGTEITVPADVEHVGCIFGPSYEKVVVLGAEDKIVCDGDFHIGGWPWSNVIYKHVNDVPGIPNAHAELNIEDMMKYDLDVVFNFSNPATTEALQQAGIAVVPYASTGKLSDTKDMLAVYAQALGGDAIERANHYSEYFDATLKKITDITSKIPEDQKKTVYFANQELLLTAGNQSDIQEVIACAGGISVSKDLKGGGKTEIPKEQFISWDPQYVFVDHAGSSGNAPAEEVISSMLGSDEYDGVQAVKNDNIYICPTGVFFWDSGVQKILLVEWMAQKLYPELFPDLDMKAELKAFYSDFYSYDLTDEQADLILAHQNPPAA